MKIAMVYTGAGVVQALSAIAKRMYPECQIMNLLDDSLIADCVKAGGMGKNVRRRLLNIFQYAYEAGADCVLLTCSSVGEAAYAGREIVPIPVLRIDDVMAKRAVQSAQRIGVIASLSTTLDPTCDLVRAWAEKLNKPVTVVRGLAEGAYEAVVAGDGERHDEIIARTATEMADRCDVLLLAQASMARMEKKLAALSGKPVYSSPESGIGQIGEWVDANAQNDSPNRER